SGRANQSWRMYTRNTTPVAFTGHYEMVFMNVNSWLCLEVASFDGTSGTALQQYTCNFGKNQIWTDAAPLSGPKPGDPETGKPEPKYNGPDVPVRFKNAASGLCMSAASDQVVQAA